MSDHYAGATRSRDERARPDATWSVDAAVDYDDPDIDRFFEAGEAIVRDALDGAPVQPSRRELAVELESGLGRVCQALAERFDGVVGIDSSPEMARQARELVKDPRVQFEVGDGATMGSVANGTADLVFSFTVFQHVPKVSVVESYLREARRVLRPGGVLVFQWNSTTRTRRWARLRAISSTLQPVGPRHRTRGRDAAEFLGSRVPVKRVERMLARAGMRLSAIRGEGTLFTWGWATQL